MYLTPPTRSTSFFSFEPDGARAVEHRQVLQRILLDHHEVGELARLDRADLLVHSQRLAPLQRGGADHLERMEPGLAQQLQLADVGEAVELVDEAAVGAHGHPAATVLVLVDEGHPEPVVVLPVDLVLGRPVVPVGAVRRAART